VLGTLGHVAAAVNPFEHEELAQLRAAAAEGDFTLGDLPLVVITRGLPDEEGPRAQELEAEHRRDHAAMAALSRRGRQLIAEGSGHHVNLDQPELIVSSVRELLTSLRDPRNREKR
jgi:hypothetical protein